MVKIFSFLITIVSLRNCLSLLKVGPNGQFKYCFLVVTIFTSISFIGFSIDLPNIALFLNLAFCFHFVIFFLCLFSQFSITFNIWFKNSLFLNSNVLRIFSIVILNVNKVLGFDIRVRIFFYCLD